MSEEECLCGVVWSHLIILLESGLCKAELGNTSVEVNHPNDWDEAEPENLVTEA